MDISSILVAVVVLLAATAISVLLFERLGFGSISGFIVAGIIVGPHTPGPVPVHAVEKLQSLAWRCFCSPWVWKCAQGRSGPCAG